MRRPTKQTYRIKVELIGNRFVEIEDRVPAQAWLVVTKRDGGRHVVLGNTTFLRDEIIAATDVKARRGSTNMEGI